MNRFRRPHRRSGRQAGDTPLESALRRTLVSHAFDAPDSDAVAREILAAAGDEPDPLADRSSGWRRATLPLVAAATVAAVVGGGVLVASLRGDGSNGPPAADRSSGITASATPLPSSPSPAASPQTRSASIGSPGKLGVGTSGLRDVKVLDLTFIGDDTGFALASAHCLSGSGRCTALLQTTDGSTWQTLGGGIDFDVAGVTGGCAARSCVDHLRFANADDGFAYGPDAFFVTTNGGATWARQQGGAEALETLDGNTIRVSANESGQCTPGCSYRVQTAAVGSTSWRTVVLPGGTPSGVGVQLSRGGTDAYLLLTQHTTGGAERAGSTLYRSTDDGASWTRGGEPCPSGPGGEVDSYQVAAGTGADVSVLCGARTFTGAYRVAVSTDGGASFRDTSGRVPRAGVAELGASDGGGALPNVLAGSPSSVLAVAGEGVFLSRDGGARFSRATGLDGSFGTIGFESTTVGRAVTADGRQIWTTRNAGRSWTRSAP